MWLERCKASWFVERLRFDKFSDLKRNKNKKKRMIALIRYKIDSVFGIRGWRETTKNILSKLSYINIFDKLNAKNFNIPSVIF